MTCRLFEADGLYGELVCLEGESDWEDVMSHMRKAGEEDEIMEFEIMVSPALVSSSFQPCNRTY